jgi:hypothetical protein
VQRRLLNLGELNTTQIDRWHRSIEVIEEDGQARQRRLFQRSGGPTIFAGSPPPSAYVRPVRPPGWTTYVKPSPQNNQPHVWSPAERAYGEELVRQWDEEKADQIRAAREANAEIASKLDAINQSIQDMPMNQYIWGGR